jgi:hypothetical protein
MRYLLVVLAAVTVAFASCTKEETVDNVDVLTLNKHWFVRVQGPTTTSNYSLFSTRALAIVEVIDTFGTQQQRLLKDTMTIDDHNLITPSIRANIKVDITALTFGAGQYKNWNSTDSVIVKEGKIVRNGGKSKTGNAVDSIYIKYAFKSAPATDYLLKGHARTGLQQDEY